jgi:hypothetical protein
MIKTLTLQNIEIYMLATQLTAAFNEQEEESKLPIKINFFLQKNINKIIELGQEIDKLRSEIIQKYGVLNEETQQYDIPQERLEEAQKELNDLFSIEQEVKINMLDINLFDNVDISEKKGNAILFMIYDPEDEEEKE